MRSRNKRDLRSSRQNCLRTPSGQEPFHWAGIAKKSIAGDKRTGDVNTGWLSLVTCDVEQAVSPYGSSPGRRWSTISSPRPSLKVTGPVPDPQGTVPFRIRTRGIYPDVEFNISCEKWNKTNYRYEICQCIRVIFVDPCSVVVNHAGLWIRRRQFESAQGYSHFHVLLSIALFYALVWKA